MTNRPTWLRGGITALWAATLLAACGSAGASSADPARAAPDDSTAITGDARFAAVRAHVQRLVREEDVPSIAVAVMKDGRILWQEGFGWADRERRLPATAHTPYSLASVTKAITSTAVMVLSERGQLRIDAPIESYLGEVTLTGPAEHRRGVTPRRCMAHSCGLPRHYAEYFAGDRVPTPAQTLRERGIVETRPGTRFRYSNIGYRALDVAIANVSGLTFGEFLRREVFLPLGMTRSEVGLHPGGPSGAAARYDERLRPIPFYVSDTPGSGDAWASAHDMLRFAAFHLGTPLPGQRSILRPETVAMMHRATGAPGAPRGSRWGLGWELSTHLGRRVVGHGGGQSGVSTRISLYPDDGLAVVVLSNTQSVPVNDIARRIAAAALPAR